MAILEVTGLCKDYPAFHLKDVSFVLEKGRIMGFIGRNGAGKTTTLKSILNIVHPSAGQIRFFGLDLLPHEDEIKSRIGYAGGAVDFYKRKKIHKLIEVTRSFYPNWDDAACRQWMEIFSLDENKSPSELSEGMKVKLALTLALSHHAELLILDEPTSGLDPVSRAELLDVFRYLKKDGVSILFSTHITSDLENCADDITYIAKGTLIASGPLDTFLEENRQAGCGETLEQIMVCHEKEPLYEKLAE